MQHWDYFNFKKKPFPHQLKYLQDHADDEYWGLFWDMGAGKTKSIIDNITYLYNTGDVQTLIVIALKGVYLNWVKREIPAHLPDGTDCYICEWQNVRSVRWEKEFKQMCEADNGLRIFVINTEAFSSRRKAGTRTVPPPKVFSYINKLIGRGGIMGVVDESSAIKDPNSNRTKNIIRFGQECQYRRILTGTPITQSPFDVWAQSEFLKPGVLGFNNYFSFKNRYATFVKNKVKIKGKLVEFEEVECYRRLEELREKLEAIGDFIEKPPGLPPKLHFVEYVPLHKEQEKHYASMREELMVELEHDTLHIENALTRLSKLHQILLGFVLDEDKVAHPIKHNRIEALFNLLDKTNDKVIIWTNFRHSLAEVTAHLKKKYGRMSTVGYHGAVSQADREYAITAFQNPNSDVRFFVGNQQSAGYGITLTASSTEVYYSNSYSLEQRLQSEDRAHRIGQDNTVNIIDLLVPNTVDEHVREALINKIDVASQVTGLIKKWI